MVNGVIKWGFAAPQGLETAAASARVSEISMSAALETERIRVEDLQACDVAYYGDYYQYICMDLVFNKISNMH